ncbi:ABC transporter substrate-binding protein [Methyloligella sp. 2.7D]|uniref:ABC transporter substrate-binding protein n=1 Tax=unclassified Methyloligella TaxID=2625955 RepID=UPI00157E05F6|nr:ABC transporter substrate-binding protein [Methyloligella sp. GL2]QKP77327.1 ABC transporter substrate-binding protein [Methyloligella sp. GL2]
MALAAGLAPIGASHAKDMPTPLQEAQAKKLTEVPIGVLRQQLRPEILPASRLDAEPEDIGLAGVDTALRENNAAGQFTGFHYTIEEETVPPDGDAVAALNGLLDRGVQYVVVDAPADTLLALADAAKDKDVLLFNIRAPETRLRQADCRANILHVAPDRTMLADALAQYLVARHWTDWLLVRGESDADKAYARAIDRAANRFGATIVDERVYREIPGRDRDEIGTLPDPSQGAAGEEGVPNFDVVVVADEEQAWSPFAPYRGGALRPVVGSAGLMPTSWNASHMKWGARQLNAHFEDEHQRLMLPVDYHGYVAARSVGEAITRNRGADFQTIKDFIHGDSFQLNAFKGIKHTYRAWDGQFRQPILLATDKIVVSVSPQPGFPHPSAPDRLVDTLGIDEDETECTAVGG